MNNQLVEVSWQDICSFGNGGWNKPEFIEECQSPLCLTVGYLIKETEDCIWLTNTVNDMLGVGVIKVIPKGCIKSVTALVKRKKK